jgi:hypothetical protein
MPRRPVRDDARNSAALGGSDVAVEITVRRGNYEKWSTSPSSVFAAGSGFLAKDHVEAMNLQFSLARAVCGPCCHRSDTLVSQSERGSNHGPPCQLYNCSCSTAANIPPTTMKGHPCWVYVNKSQIIYTMNSIS